MGWQVWCPIVQFLNVNFQFPILLFLKRTFNFSQAILWNKIFNFSKFFFELKFPTVHTAISENKLSIIHSVHALYHVIFTIRPRRSNILKTWKGRGVLHLENSSYIYMNHVKRQSRWWLTHSSCVFLCWPRRIPWEMLWLSQLYQTYISMIYRILYYFD